jgi:hypothetical protein
MVKTRDELALLRVSGKLLSSVFEMLDGLNLDGMSTLQINDLVERFITVDLAARPASKGQYGFKFGLNGSINHVVCHGVPDARAIIRDGDIINLDITLEKNGFIADSSKTYLVGNPSPAAKRLVQVAHEAMWKGIREVRPGAHIGDRFCYRASCQSAWIRGRAGILRARHRPRDARGAAGDEFWPEGHRPAIARRHGLHDRAHDQSGHAQGSHRG